ncbi:MAG TPA: glutamyl-tRNA reductase, partial [Schlesneria sp.]
MNLLALYCTHQTTPLKIRERLAFATQDQLNAAYQRLKERFPETESVVLSTCNRVELYIAR